MSIYYHILWKYFVIRYMDIFNMYWNTMFCGIGFLNWRNIFPITVNNLKFGILCLVYQLLIKSYIQLNHKNNLFKKNMLPISKNNFLAYQIFIVCIVLCVFTGKCEAILFSTLSSISYKENTILSVFLLLILYSFYAKILNLNLETFNCLR